MTAVSNAPGTAICGCSIRRLGSTFAVIEARRPVWRVLAVCGLAA